MTDIELLEAAAKAANINTSGCALTYGPDEHWKVRKPERDFGFSEWNPLVDDGDALRLAVKLGLHIQIDFDDPDCQCVYVWGDWPNFDGAVPHMMEKDGGDRSLAVRRAIARAAAEIGRNMK